MQETGERPEYDTCQLFRKLAHSMLMAAVEEEGPGVLHNPEEVVTQIIADVVGMAYLCPEWTAALAREAIWHTLNRQGQGTPEDEAAFIARAREQMERNVSKMPYPSAWPLASDEETM